MRASSAGSDGDGPQCPRCGAENVQLLQESSSSGAATAGKTAGALLYGPVGLIAGAILDGMKDGLTGRGKNVVHYQCLRCKQEWNS
jgi:hypothetical protein